ncbi:MAG: tetratricopeptide repeat protein [Fimbriimonadales bacterium]
MNRFVRVALGVVALLLAVAGLVWWVRPSRLTLLEPNRLTTMSETEQIEWLLERILERSEVPGAFRNQLYEWFPRLRTKYCLTTNEVELLILACAEYDLPHLLKRLRLWARDPKNADDLRLAEVHLCIKRREWAQALQTARAILDLERKHRAYYELAKGLNRAGQLDEARRMLQEAIDQLPSQREQVALEAVQLGFPDLAEQATMRFSARRLQEREHAYVAVALAYAKAGRDSDAIRVARQINDRILRGIVYGELAITRMRRGEWAAATALIEQAREPTGYVRIARTLTELGRVTQAQSYWRQAEQLARRLPEPERSRALLQIATEYANAGDPDTAIRLYEQTNARTASPEKFIALRAIAVGYAAKGKREKALAVLDLHKQRDGVSPAHANLYALIARELYHSGYHEDARCVLQHMRTFLQQIFPRDWLTDYAWVSAAGVLASSEALPLAQELARWLEREAALMSDPRMGSTAEERLAAIYAQMGDLPKAVHYAARAPDYDAQAGRLIQILRIIVESRALRAGQ